MLELEMQVTVTSLMWSLEEQGILSMSEPALQPHYFFFMRQGLMLYRLTSNS